MTRQSVRRTIFVIGSARAGGAEGQMVRLACELHARGEDVRMYFLVFGGPLTARLDQAGVPWEVMRRDDWPPSSTARNLFGLFRLARSMRKARPDVVVAWLAGAVWPALLCAELFTNAKRVAGFRGDVVESDLRWQAYLFRRAVRRADAVTINSPTLRPEAGRWSANDSRVHFIGNGVDLPDVRADVSTMPPTCVVVANFRHYKGHDTLIEALARVREPLRVRLCGEGDERAAVARLAKDLHVDSLLTFVDEPADVQAELAAAQFAIHPSRTEGLSNAILEELSFGLPVVATDAGGTSLLVSDGLNGRLVPIGDPDQLASAIDQIASSAERRAEMSQQARERATQFSWPQSTGAYLGLLEQIAPAQVSEAT